MHTDDEELISLFKRLGIGTGILLIFSIVVIIFLVKRFSPHSSKVVEAVNNQESIYVLIDDNKCSTCKRIKEVLAEEKINYYEINIDKDSHYEEFLKSISATENEVDAPTLMYIREGQLDSTIVDIKDEEILRVFISNTSSN